MAHGQRRANAEGVLRSDAMPAADSEGKPIRLRLGRAMATRAALAAGLAQRILEDLADGPGATPALRTATEAAVHRPGGFRRVGRLRCRAHVVVGQHIARADDHVASPRQILSASLLLISQAAGFDAKQKSQLETLQPCKKLSIFSAFRSRARSQKLQFL
jgi:hypothetical protein